MRDRKKRGKRTARKLSTLNPAAAGLNVGSTFHVVAVSPDRVGSVIAAMMAGMNISPVASPGEGSSVHQAYFLTLSTFI